MVVESGVELQQQTAFVGLLEDRCLSHDNALGTVCLIGPDRVVTCAHFVVPFVEKLEALKVRFSQANREFGVAEVLFHPQFDIKLASQLCERRLKEQLPSLSLQKYNVAVLRLSPDLAPLSDEDKKAINQRLSAELVKDQGLSGKLEEVDLALVIQTLTNGRRTGSLVICDERNLPRARMFCNEGRVSHAQFGPLENDRAIYQIFSRHLSGNFYFKSQAQPDWQVSGSINRPTDMLLIEAHRRLDEIPELLLRLGGEEVILSRARPALDEGTIPEQVRADAKTMWPFIDGTVPVSRLWRVARVDDYSIFKPLAEMLICNQVVPVLQHSAPVPLRPVSLGTHLPLKPWDSLQIYGFDCGLDSARQATGKLLGTLGADDPWHLVHNLELPEDAAGAPVLKDGMLIGVHCGSLPTDKASSEIRKTLSQMVWSEAIIRCGQPRSPAPSAESGIAESAANAMSAATLNFSDDMDSAGDERQRAIVPNAQAGAPTESLKKPEIEEPQRQSQSLSGGGSVVAPGCRELAQVECPRCGSSSLDSARFCKICGQPLIDEVSWDARPVKQASSPLTGALLIAVVALLAVVACLWFNQPEPVPNRVPSQPAQENFASFTADNAQGTPITVELQRADRSAGKFVSVQPLQGIKPSDLLRVHIHVAANSFVYVLYQGSGGNHVQLQYPEAADDAIVLASSVVTIPKEQNPHELNGFALGGPAGTDTLVVLSSPEKLLLVGQEGTIDNVFQKAMQLLEAKKSTGLAASSTELGVLPNLGEGAGNQRTAPFSVYLSVLKLTHGR